MLKLRFLRLYLSIMIYITRRERFCAAHKLHREDWSAEKNEAIFGYCSNPNWHGHNYELFVTVKGEINPETGFLIDLKTMKAIIHKHSNDKVDKNNSHMDGDVNSRKMASTEVIAVEIFRVLRPNYEEENVILHSVRLHETETNSIEYFGD